MGVEWPVSLDLPIRAQHKPSDGDRGLERRTGTPLAQVRFCDAARILFFAGQLSVPTVTVSVHPRVQSRALTSVRT